MTDQFKKEISKRITKCLLDIQILKLIAATPMWGYRIKKTVENELEAKLRHAALYPLLKQLEKEGFVVYQKQRQNGRTRKVYTATEKGKAYQESFYAVLNEQIKVKNT